MPAPNVLLIIMDSVRARNTSLYGHRRDTTPFLSAMASSSTVYRQSRSPSNWSLPSHASIFTGFHVPEHGLTRADDEIEPGSTVFDDLRDRGYETGLFTENPYLTALDTGLASGFDTVEGGRRQQLFDAINPDEYKGEIGTFLKAVFRSHRPIRSLANGVVSKLAWDYPTLLPAKIRRSIASGVIPGSTYTNLFCDWVERVSGPWAACINYMDAHHPYHPAPSFDQWDDGSIASIQQSIESIPMGFYTGTDPWWKCELLEYLYDGTIRQIDHEIARVVRFLREQDALDDTLVVVTSDHGEGFGEMSNVRDIPIVGHNVGESEVNLHVPLLVKSPRQHVNRVCDDPVSLTVLPDMIRRAVEGNTDPDERTDRRVVAQTQGLLNEQRDQIREANVDVTPFVGQAKVVYEADGEQVRKWTKWRQQRATTRCVDSQNSYNVGSFEEGCVETVFDGFEDAGIRRNRSSTDVDEATAQRLEDLGYR